MEFKDPTEMTREQIEAQVRVLAKRVYRVMMASKNSWHHTLAEGYILPMTQIYDGRYGLDSAKSVVLYGLGNMNGYTVRTDPNAREVRARLRELANYI